jgi:hypothetical protein
VKDGPFADSLKKFFIHRAAQHTASSGICDGRAQFAEYRQIVQ